MFARKQSTICAFALSGVIAATAAAAEEIPVKLGVLADMSGIFSDIGGPGATEATKMAVEDFMKRPGSERFKIEVVSAESGLPAAAVEPLVELARRLRVLKGHDLEEGVSTRLLVYCASLIDAGLSPRDAVRAAMIEPLTDEPDVRTGLMELAQAVIR